MVDTPSLIRVPFFPSPFCFPLHMPLRMLSATQADSKYLETHPKHTIWRNFTLSASSPPVTHQMLLSSLVQVGLFMLSLSTAALFIVTGRGGLYASAGPRPPRPPASRTGSMTTPSSR